MNEWISTEQVQAICWTLLHSLWQGLLAAVLAAIVVMATKKSKANIRYNLLSFVLISFIAAVLFTFLYQPGIIPPLPDAGITAYSAANDVTPGINEAGWLPSLQKETFFQSMTYYGNKYAGLITGLWALLFLLNFLKLLVGLHYVHRIRNHQVTMVTDFWKQKLDNMKNTLEIRQAVALMESGLIKIPVAIGFLKPVILVPLGMLSQLSPEQAESVLLHELSHIRRKDFAVNLLQRFAECIFFFNPFIAWLSSRIREEREACCDDIVVEHIADKRSYFEALVSFRQPDLTSYGHAMTLGKNNTLLNRVKRMITQENKKLNAMEKLTLLFVLLAITAFGFIPQQNNTEKKPVDYSGQAKIDGLVKEYRSSSAIAVAGKEAVAKPFADTVPPKKLSFSNISSVLDDDGSSKKVIVNAKASDGKTYSYQLKNDKIIELAIDGIKIKKEDFGKYTSLIDSIEAARKDTNILVLKEQALNLNNEQQAGLLRLKEIAQNENNLQLQANELLKLATDNQQQGQQLQLKEMVQNQNNLQIQANKILQLSTANNLQVAQEQQYNNLLLLKEKVAANDSVNELTTQTLIDLKNDLILKGQGAAVIEQTIQFHDTNYELSSIISDLFNAGLISDRDRLSFTLNDHELVVNGKKQQESLHETLRKKYIKNKKDYFKYNAKPGSKSTDVQHTDD